MAKHGRHTCKCWTFLFDRPIPIHDPVYGFIQKIVPANPMACKILHYPTHPAERRKHFTTTWVSITIRIPQKKHSCGQMFSLKINVYPTSRRRHLKKTFIIDPKIQVEWYPLWGLLSSFFDPKIPKNPQFIASSSHPAPAAARRCAPFCVTRRQFGTGGCRHNRPPTARALGWTVWGIPPFKMMESW